jgi:hypothetical protein
MMRIDLRAPEKSVTAGNLAGERRRGLRGRSLAAVRGQRERNPRTAGRDQASFDFSRKQAPESFDRVVAESLSEIVC